MLWVICSDQDEGLRVMGRLDMVRLGPSLTLPLALAGVTTLLGVPALAQVSATGAGGLNTVVNGVVGGSCSSGLCNVDGGTAAGANLLHRFSSFDTRGAITGVQINNGGFSNVVVGVTAPLGSFIDKPVSLSTPGSLFWLSPGGIAVSGSGGFVNTTQLTLSTATSQRIGEGRFDVFGTTPQQAALLSGSPRTGAADLVLDPALRAIAGMAPDPEIVLQGVSLTVDRSLLVDNPAGLVSVAGSTLSAASSTGNGGSLTLTGTELWVDGSSSLLATGPTGGGLIQVGGSWQNSDPSVRQALRTWIGSGALLDASATFNGPGGTVVAWSDITNPASATVVAGTLLAKGGPQGGDGGRIETSGAWLAVDGIRVSTAAPFGKTGVWLLDPYDLTIGGTGNPVNITTTGSALSPPIVLSASGGSSYLNVTTLTSNLGLADVIVSTGVGGTNFGDITIGSQISYQGANSLTIHAANNIYLDNGISISGGGDLFLQADAGGVTQHSTVAGTISINNGTLSVTQGGNTSFAGVIKLDGSTMDLEKDGLGVLTLTGRLQLGNNAAPPLQDRTAFVTVNQGKLVFSPASGNAIALDYAYTVYGKPIDLFFDGSGEAVVNASINLSAYTGNNVLVVGDLSKFGTGLLALNAANTIGPTLLISEGTLAYASADFFGNGRELSRTLIIDGGVFRSSISNSFGAGGGEIFLGADGGTWQVDQGLTVSFGSAINGSGNFTKSGAGTLILNGANGYTGSTFVNQGTLSIGGSLPDATALTVTTGALYQLGASDVIGSIAGGGGIALGAFTLTAGGNGASTTYSGSMSGAGSFTKAGSGTLVLNGANTYTGATTVTGGILTVNQTPPTTATCDGGSSNICPGATVPTSQVDPLLTPSLNVVPGFSVSTTTGTATTPSSGTTTTSSSSSTSTAVATTASDSSKESSTTAAVPASSSSAPASADVQVTTTALPSDGTTLISSTNVSVISSLESSFTTTDSSLTSNATTSGGSATGGTSSTSSSSSTTNTSSSTSSTSATTSSTSSESTSSSTNPDAAKSDTTKSDTAKSDTTKSESAKSDEGKGSQQGSANTPAAATGNNAGAPPTTTVPAQQAAVASQQADQQSGRQALSNLVPERSGSALSAPSVPQMQQSLSGATNLVRSGALGPQSSLPSGA